MNETNETELEILLQAWRPRRPSAKCRKNIFAERQSPPRAITLPFAWLVPVAACLLILLASISRDTDKFSRVAQAGSQGQMIAMVLSNRSFAACLPGGFQNDQNMLRNTFEWTNASHYTPSIRSLIH